MMQIYNFKCEGCNHDLPKGNRSFNKKFCDECLVKRRTERNIQRAKRWKHINLTEQEINFLNENNISLSKLVHATLREYMKK